MSAEGGTRTRSTPNPLASAGGRGAWALSALIHLGIVVLAFFVVWTVTPGEKDVTPAVASFDDPGLAPMNTLDNEEDLELATEPIELGPEPIEPEDEVPLSELLRDLEDARDEVEIERTTEPPKRRLRTEQRRFPEVRFAGTGASNAEKIVYVVDASGSLRSMWPALIDELTRSIERLAPTQRFQVVFFLDTEDGPNGYTLAPTPGGADRQYELIRATRANIAHVRDWFGALSPRGRGEPLEAIEIAFQLEPDAVFILARFTGIATDPDTSELLGTLDSLNPRTGPSRNRPVAVNGIQFLDRDPEGLLEAVAREHGGPGAGDAYTLLTRDAINERRSTPE